MSSDTTNLIAIVPRYKFERGPSFLMACDAAGLNWLISNFSNLSASNWAAFVIGDDPPITSDGRCKLAVVANSHGIESVVQNGPSEFTWRVRVDDILAIREKLRVLLASNLPGHQYFGSGGGPFQTIVVTKDEEPIELIRAMRDERPPAVKYP